MRERFRAKWDTWMGKIKSKIPHLSRPWRIVRNMVCIAIAAYFAWLCLGQPVLSERWMFRQAEKLALVGPSEILGTITMPEGLGSYKRMILGETEHGYCLHPLNEPNTVSSSTQLFYQKKSEGLTLFPAPNHDYAFPGDPFTIALLLFSDVKAARAEVDLTLSAYVSEEETFERTWAMSAQVREEGFFILSHRIESVKTHESTALGYLNYWYGFTRYAYHEPAYADVRLYNEVGVLILETRIDLADHMDLDI